MRSRNIWVAAILAVGCDNFNKFFEFTAPQQPKTGEVVVWATEFYTMQLVEGESAKNRLAVCFPDEMNPQGRSVSGDMRVVRPNPDTISFVANDTVTYYCESRLKLSGKEARVPLSAVSVGAATVEVSFWIDSSRKTPASFKVEVTKTP